MPCRTPWATNVLKNCSGGRPILVATPSAARSSGSAQPNFHSNKCSNCFLALAYDHSYTCWALCVNGLPLGLIWLFSRRIITTPNTTSTLPGIAVDETFSPSMTNANAPANRGINSEIVAVTTDGNRSEAKANAKLGIAVQSIARHRKISRLVPPNASKETVVRTTHPIAIRATLPKAKVIKVTLVDSGACGFSPHAGKDRHTTPLVPPHCKDITNEAAVSEAFRKSKPRP